MKTKNKQQDTFKGVVHHHRLTEMLAYTLKVFGWLSVSFETGFIVKVKDFHLRAKTLGDLEKTRGTIFALAYVKAVRNTRLSYLSGENKTDAKVKVKLTHDGIPVCLGPWIGPIRSKTITSFQRRFVMTRLYASRALSLGSDPDLTTITASPVTGKHRLVGSSEIQAFWKALGYRKPLKNRSLRSFKEYHFTTKAGPNGHAISTSLADLFTLPESLRESIGVVGGEVLKGRMDLLLSSSETLKGRFRRNGELFRKLFHFSDIEDKVRVIAIGDYWSQAALKPLHHHIFKLRKKIPQDFSFNQQGYRQFISGWKVFHSVDLTAFTDRFPISFISDMLEYHVGREYTAHWKNIMVGYPFPHASAGEVHYQVGNPMGMYSSWATSTRAHHFVIFLACAKVGQKWESSKYCMLGDDVLIGDDHLAETYKSFILELGVTFSPRKTHSSKFLAEFAKCYFFRGEEITPFPINALREARKRYYVLLNVLYEERTRGWRPSVPYKVVLDHFFKYISIKPLRLRKKLVKMCVRTEVVMKVTKGFESAETSVNGYLRTTRSPVPYRSDSECENILKSAAIMAFVDDNDSIRVKKGSPLGELALNLVIALTSSDQGLTLLENLAIPLLYCYGLVEDQYVNIQKEAWTIDSSRGGDWPLLLKAIALPLNDQVFTERQAHTIARGNAIIGKQIANSFRELEIYHSLGKRR
jgi:hypothetical protein